MFTPTRHTPPPYPPRVTKKVKSSPGSGVRSGGRGPGNKGSGVRVFTSVRCQELLLERDLVTPMGGLGKKRLLWTHRFCSFGVCDETLDLFFPYPLVCDIVSLRRDHTLPPFPPSDSDPNRN